MAGLAMGVSGQDVADASCEADGTPRPTDNDERTKMSMTPGRASATIHQFPAGGRAGSGRFGAVRDGGEASVSRLFPPVAVVEFGSGWYHEAAIEAENTTRKH